MKVQRTPGKGTEQLKIALKGLDGKVGKVGWFPSAKYPDGTPVAYVATIQEFGDPASNIPARPTMRPTIVKHEKDWKYLAETGSRNILKGNATIGTVMDAIGQVAAGQIREAISELQEPPLKESTIAARRRQYANKKLIGSLTKPLVGVHKLLLNSVNSTVEDKK